MSRSYRRPDLRLAVLHRHIPGRLCAGDEAERLRAADSQSLVVSQIHAFLSE